MLSLCRSGEIFRNFTEREGLQPGSQNRGAYNKWKHLKIKSEFCLGPCGRFACDPGICTDLLASAVL